MRTSYTTPESWHKCRKCGEIYLAYSESSTCPACSTPKNPKTHITPKEVITTNITGKRSILKEKREFQPNLKPNEPVLQKEILEPVAQDEPKNIVHAPHRPRKVKLGKRFVVFFAIWIGLLGILSLYLRRIGMEYQGNLRKNEQKIESIDLNKRGKAVEFQNRANAFVPALAQEFFLNASPQVLSQICRKRPRIVQIIAEDAFKIPPYQAHEMPTLVSSNVAWCGETMCLETLWKDYRERLMELVFVEDDGEWKIDWEAFSRSSSAPWTKFAAETEDAEGTFRLLVRERKTVKASEGKISVAFHEPSLFHGTHPSVQSMPFEIDRNSRSAQRILAALSARETGPQVLESMYPQNDMPQTARVRVKIRRVMVDGVKVFTVEEVQACHWLGWDEPGIVLPSGP